MNDTAERMVFSFVLRYYETAGMVQVWVTSLEMKRPESLISPGLDSRLQPTASIGCGGLFFIGSDHEDDPIVRAIIGFVVTTS